MPVSRYANPFPPFSLSVDEKEELLHVSNEVISETMAKCEKFLFQDKRCLDPEIWKTVRERENTRVFHNRLAGAGTGNRDMHLLLTLATVVGSLNDVMYGVINPTIEAFRIKSVYVEDTLFDMAVLESIVMPTPDMPYESMSLRWGVKRVPLHVRLVSKHTDTVYIETTGMRELSNGERVGVHLFHSVSVSQMPPLPQYDRFNLSLCAIWREVAPGKCMVYFNSYFEFKESFKVPFVILSMADACLAIDKVIDCMQLKKLAWLVQNKTVLGSGHGASSVGSLEEGCSVCGSQSRSARRGLRSACAICNKCTCGKCRVNHTLRLFAPDGQLLRHEMRFCVSCLTSAKRLDAAIMAQDDASGGIAGSKEDASRTVSNATYHMSSASSVTSTTSGDENGILPKRRTESTSSSTKGRPLTLSS